MRILKNGIGQAPELGNGIALPDLCLNTAFSRSAVKAKDRTYQNGCSSMAHDQPNEHIDGNLVGVGGRHAKVQRQDTKFQYAEAGCDYYDKGIDDLDNRNELCGCRVGCHMRAHAVLSANNNVSRDAGSEDQSEHSEVLVKPDAFHGLSTALCVCPSEEPEC